MDRPADSRPLAALMLSLAIAAAAAAAPARAQWAASSQVSQRVLNATYANGAGFTLLTAGQVAYDGPINTAEAGVVPPTLAIRLNGATVFDGELTSLAVALPDRAFYPRLSPRLSEAVIAVGSDTSLTSGLGETLPLFTQLAASQVDLTLHSVDGQSLSVYPRFSPSLPMPRESGLYNDPNNPNNPNAAKAGPTVLESATAATAETF